jgi:hypothetical protein
MKLRFSAAIELDEVSTRMRFAAIASLVTAGLTAISSLGGIVLPATYARETPIWRVEGIGQDWANLLVAVPWLVVAAIAVLRGSRRGQLLLGGGLAYIAYAFAVYAFDVHFNALFLIYCAALGLASYALGAIVSELKDARAWFDERVPNRFAGGFAMVCAVAFALLWMSQIVPALIGGRDPVGLDDAGLPTNPAHVLDLALALPTIFASGWLLWHRRAAGYAFVPIVLGFILLMGAALSGMAIALHAAHLTTSLALVIGGLILVAIGATALVWMLAAMHAAPSGRVVTTFGTA